MFHVKRSNKLLFMLQLIILNARVIMKKIEFETLAAAGALESVVVFDTGAGYELWAYPRSAYHDSNVFKTAKGETRLWSSLDVLVKFIRSMGYAGVTNLDTRAAPESMAKP